MTCRRLQAGTTLVELLVAMVVALIMIAIMFAVFNQASITVRTAGSIMDAYQSAQAGFDIMTQRLSDATLNTYYDYDSATAPTTYLRHSDLHFYIGKNNNTYVSTLSPAANANSGFSIYFQAPEGYSNGTGTYSNTPGLLNACGYFIEFGPETSYWPSLFTSGTFKPRYRYRLMQAIQSTEYNGIYADTETLTPWPASSTTTWVTPLNNTALPIAENVILLIAWPREDPSVDSTGTFVSPDYQYNSRQGYPPTAAAGTSAALQSEQLPPILQITMVAIDETSAIRLQNGTTPPAAIEAALTGGTEGAAPSNGPGLFTTASTTQYAADLATLEGLLISARIRYQLFTTSVTLRESKWSSGQ